MNQRSPRMMRVDVEQLRRVLLKRLARPLVEDCVAELEAAPEGDIFDGPIPDEARTLARLDLERKRKRRSA